MCLCFNHGDEAWCQLKRILFRLLIVTLLCEVCAHAHLAVRATGKVKQGVKPFRSLEPFSVDRSKDLFTDLKESALYLEEHWHAHVFHP